MITGTVKLGKGQWLGLGFGRPRERRPAGVADLRAVEVEPLEPLQSPRLRRRRHEGGEALVAERVASETKPLQGRPQPQGLGVGGL